MVGRGSFGKVYLVKKKDKMDQPLALKVLAKDVVSKRNLMIKTQGKSPNQKSSNFGIYNFFSLYPNFVLPIN